MDNYKVSRIVISVMLLITFLVFVYIFNIEHPVKFTYDNGKANVRYEKAKVLEVTNKNLRKSMDLKNIYFGSQKLKLKILTGQHKGDIGTTENYLTDIHNVFAKPDMTVVIELGTISQSKYSIVVYNYYRAPVTYIFVLLFFIALCCIGRTNGLKTIIGIAFTLICIVFLFIPMLYNGYSAIGACLIVVALTTCTTLLIISGFSSKSFCAIIGTFLGVLLSIIIGMIFGEMTHLSGLNMQNAETLSLISTKTGMKVQGLLLASVIIASLGALLDLNISIASSIQELYNANNDLKFKELFKSGMNIGKDLMGTMSNTLILAFTGSSLNILVVIYSYNISFTQIINMDIINTQIIEGVTGSLAVVLTVPITAFVCAKLTPIFTRKLITQLLHKHTTPQLLKNKV